VHISVFSLGIITSWPGQYWADLISLLEDFYFAPGGCQGKKGRALRKAIYWMYRYLKEMALIPVTIMVESNIFFEEFIVKTKVEGGKEIQVKPTELLMYDEKYKVRSLRLYFDRLYRRLSPF